ncbi:MAG: hypothetical protein JEY94_09930 [Melioribacteraceae bacterium]|nr:hypothetical protein [Melioribacteraceae bacterium]
MADQQVHEMISAFASGCIDKENYRNFKEYLKTGADLPLKEMGEIQNIVSLIPIILDQEVPDPELKGRVAKQLKNYQDEIKAKIRDKKKLTTEDDVTAKSKTKTKRKTFERDEHKMEAPESFSFNSGTSEKKKADQKKKDDNYKYDIVGQTKEFDEPFLINQKFNKSVEADKKPFITIGSIVVSIILVILLVISFFHFTSEISELKGESLNLKADLVQFKMKQSESNKFIEDYKKLIDFVSYSDISIVKMTSSNNNFTGSAKLLLSFENGEALLELSDIPVPQQDSVYKLWMIGQNASYSIGSFIPNENERFLKIAGMPFIDKANISLFRLTVEAGTNGDSSDGRMILYGTLKK